ncbi:shikimate dehydrogenase [Candidatus Pelagibacter bacterium nBUS_33]|jgi:shikimate dehydrogenase|uniref:shikimate dehydrogenase n=1 Tax=Candidatus Pelagibacter bacterium nBUS_33 TaxID=3374193 RepID=UPI003EBFBF8E
MKKFLVIGNPIDHSLSPKLHNYWIKKNKINAIYEKQKLENSDLEKLLFQVKEKKIYGINVTVPFKNSIIPFLDDLTSEAKTTKSVNTIYLENNRVIGHNTDIGGFETSIYKSNINLENKKILILGAGGVVPSIIYALTKMKVSEITLSNRTKEKAENLKKYFKDIKIIKWGDIVDFDMIINATTLGLKEKDKINLNFPPSCKNKLFYDVIYNPKETSFLKTGKNMGNKIINGKLMFIYQAFLAFDIWHKLKPHVNEEVLKLLD